MTQMLQKCFWSGGFSESLHLCSWALLAVMEANLLANASKTFFFSLSRYCILLISTQIFLLWSDFNFGLVSNITDDAKSEGRWLVFKVFLLIVFYIFERPAFCRASQFVYLFVFVYLPRRQANHTVSFIQSDVPVECADGEYLLYAGASG